MVLRVGARVQTEARDMQVLSANVYKGFEVGEKVFDSDQAAWAEWKAKVFDIEEALHQKTAREERAATRAKAKGKPMPKRKHRVLVTVKAMRAGAY